MTEDKVSHKDIIKRIRPELEKVLSFLERELYKVRTERASPSLVEDIEVEYLGKKFDLKELAAISVPQPREIVIQPWDKSYIEDIVKALERNSKMGSSPVVEKELIRMRLPSLSEEFRKDLIHFISEKQEEAKRTIRRWRDEAWREIQEGFREGKIREDDKFKGKDELKDLVEEFHKKIEEMIGKKKKEIES
ncbi:MAG: ribosome-recycling factor [Patescibacteria group bacterium]|nr:ribosome-recycling factor [Patescibacteria group bacterium]